MTAVFSTAQIRAVEQTALQQRAGDAYALMQQAGAAAFWHLQQQWPQAETIIVVCGGGNNAGDGYVLAVLAQQHGLQVHIYSLVNPQQLQGAAQQAYQACQALSLTLEVWTSETVLASADVIVDAILGIGIQGPVRDLAALAVIAINQSNCPVLAIDIPSGLCADTGTVVNNAVKADITVTFLAYKIGLLTATGPQYTGTIYCEPLDIPAAIWADYEPIATVLDWRSLHKHYLAPRARDAHKGDFGHVLIIGGDYGMAGSVILAATAAARTGAGLISVATRPEHITALLARQPECMCHGVTDADALKPLLARATVVVIGPGLGQSAWSLQLYQAAVASQLPLIIDADALNLLALEPQALKNSILTPHPGEAGRLLNISTTQVQQQRLQTVTQLVEKYAGVVVLKGAGTLIADHRQRIQVCTAGNPGMASGGMGDVLSGILGSLVAQKLSLEIAAALGVCLHATAADRAKLAGERGLLATDIIAALQSLVN